MDQQIFITIHSFAGKNQVLDALGIFFAVYLVYILPLFLVLLFWRKYNKHLWLALFTSLIARLGVEVVKRLVNRPRPFEALQTNPLVVDFAGHGMSFSSGHTVILFSIAFSFYGTKYFGLLLVLAALGSMARIFVGVHYPLDIVASILIAAVVVGVGRGLFKNHFLS